MTIKGLLVGITLFIVVLLFSAIAALTWWSARDRAIDTPVSSAGLVIPTFTHQVIDFVPNYDPTLTLPFSAGAIIDIDGDGVEELFLGGGIEQNDVFYRFDGNRFVDITASTSWQKEGWGQSFGAVSLDFDRDGDNDLLVTRQSGVWLHLNAAGRFTAQRLDLKLDAVTVPLSVAPADLNRDGLVDLFVSGYIARSNVEGETIFNQEYGGVSALFIGREDGGFDDVTQAAGLQYRHNTFRSLFIDLDSDGLEDLVVAHDTGQVRTWRNTGGLTFEKIPNPSSEVFSYPMGIAVTDYRNDGLPDLIFSNVGSTTADFLVRGDLREDQVLHKDWWFFANEGDFVFVDRATDAALADHEFGWGAVFEDFNLDGRDDLAVSGNYVGFPLHKVPAWRLDGRFMLQTENGEFAEVGAEAGVRNRAYGISPLVADFNADGYPDLVHVNLLGP